MTEKKLKKILAYCQKAAQGQWTRDPAEPKSIKSNPEDSSDKQKGICQLTGDTHTEDWNNYHFIVNARRDLPIVAGQCLEMLELMKKATRQIELDREKKQWQRLKKINKQLKLKQENQRLELMNTSQRHLQLEEINENLQREITQKQTELEHLTGQYQFKLTEKQTELAEKQTELERIQLQHQQESDRKQTQFEETTMRLKTQLHVAHERIEKGKDTFYSSEDNNPDGVGSLLGKLDQIEAYLDAPLNLDADCLKKTSQNSKPDENQPEPFNDKLIDELNAIENDLPDYSTTADGSDSSTDKITKTTDLAATANEFAEDAQTETTAPQTAQTTEQV
ncbi:MAG TPA: hypothetical protein ENH94_06160 [Phycisphaerales bacterium]|nr:hypothetical protein [Phycisphaerales bacterium]